MDGKGKGAEGLFLSAEAIAALEERRHVHQFNAGAVRHTRSLGDLAGLKDMGLHLVRVEPGHATTEHHFHGQDEEFLYILSGRGVAAIGAEEFPVGPGDFMAFPANSPAHSMRVPEEAGEDLVYLMGGTRSRIDICTYPRLDRRMYRVDGVKEYIDLADVKKV
ncbi:MAG TPA: cupin domain-containing protein [Parvibaculum sp.]|nr:cupin domain-containing protein [Parvibaculum sp.]